MMANQKPSEPQALPSIRRALVLSFARKYTTLLISIPSVMILSRLLTPSEVGIYSVGLATLALVHMLRDFGVSEYLVQASHLDDSVARSAFTINLSIAWVLAIALFFASPWIGVLYREPGLTRVLRVLSINFFLLPFGSTVNALLTRSMQFGILYKISLAEQCARTSTTLTLAFLGFGYMSPAWGSVVGMCANVLACSTWGRAYRIRGLSLRHWKSVTRFGLQQTFGDVMNRLGFYAPDFVIGRVLGFADVGIYSRGYGLINLFRTRVMGAIGAVAFPAFAHKHRTSEGARGLYLKSVTFVTGISLPFAAFACLMAYPIIRIMFGSQWDGAVPILHLLAAAAFVGMLAPQFGQLLTAMGKVGVSTATGTAVQIMRFAVIIPAAFWSLEAVAASQILTAGFAVVIKYALLRKYAGVSTLESLRALSPSLGLTAAAMIIPVLIYALMPFSEAGLWLPLALSCLGAGIGWLVGAWALKHPLWLELTDVLNRFRQRRAAQA